MAFRYVAHRPRRRTDPWGARRPERSARGARACGTRTIASSASARSGSCRASSKIFPSLYSRKEARSDHLLAPARDAARVRRAGDAQPRTARGAVHSKPLANAIRGISRRDPRWRDVRDSHRAVPGRLSGDLRRAWSSWASAPGTSRRCCTSLRRTWSARKRSPSASSGALAYPAFICVLARR